MLNFTSSKTNHLIGVAVTPNVGLEVAVVDKKTSTVIKYGYRELEYNLSTREVSDYNLLKAGLLELYEELDIDTKSSIYMVLPNVHFEFVNLSTVLVDEAIDTALLSKAEESYIFRRTEPVTAWSDINVKNKTNGRYIVYSSLQSNVVEKIKEIVADLGGSVVGIENSHSAFLRALDFSGVEPAMKVPDTSWDVLLISANGYSLFTMVGDKLVDYTEMPIALKSFAYEEAYQAIAVSVLQVLSNYPVKKLLIASQSNDISAEVLKSQLTFDGEITSLDFNKFTKKSIFQLSPAIPDREAERISPNVIGAAVARMSKFPLILNALGKGKEGVATETKEIELFGNKVNLSSELVRVVCLIMSLIFAVVFGVAVLALRYNGIKYQDQSAQLEKNIEDVKRQIDELQGMEPETVIDINAIINSMVAGNVKAVNFFDSLSYDIPKHTWLVSYQNKNGYMVNIKGFSIKMVEIYSYFRSLKAISPDSTIRLTKLKLVPNMFEENDVPYSNSDLKLYSFEISNSEIGFSDINPEQNAGVNPAPDGGSVINSQPSQSELEAPPALEEIQ